MLRRASVLGVSGAHAGDGMRKGTLGSTGRTSAWLNNPQQHQFWGSLVLWTRPQQRGPVGWRVAVRLIRGPTRKGDGFEPAPAHSKQCVARFVRFGRTRWVCFVVRHTRHTKRLPSRITRATPGHDIDGSWAVGGVCGVGRARGGAVGPNRRGSFSTRGNHLPKVL